MDPDSRVMLTEIKGDIKRIFDKHDRYTEDMRRLEQNLTDYKRTTDDRLHTHGNRIGAIEAANTLKIGQAQGIEKSVKVMYAVIGGSGATIVTGLAAIIARAKGL